MYMLKTMKSDNVKYVRLENAFNNLFNAYC